MTFLLTEDQRMLQDAARRYLSERHPLSLARNAAARTHAERLAQWRELAAQGWPALLAPAEQDGLGLGLSDAWVVAEAAGRHLMSLPLVANIVVLPTLVDAGINGLAAQWAREVMQGDRYFADASVQIGRASCRERV